MIVSRNAGKFAVKTVSFFLGLLFVIAGIIFLGPVHMVNADAGATAWWISQWDDPDAGKIGISTWGVNKGDVVQVTVNSANDIFFNGSTSGDVSCISEGDSITVQYTYTGDSVEFGVKGTNISNNSVSVGSVSVVQSASTPTPEPTSAPTPTPTPTPKPTPVPTTAPTETKANNSNANNNSSSSNNASSGSGSSSAEPAQPATPAADNGGDAAPAAVVAGNDTPAATTTQSTEAKETDETAETTDPTETAASDGDAAVTEETVMAVVGEVKEGESYDQTVVLDETHEDGSPIVMGLNSTTQEELNAAKARKQMVTTSIWVVFLVLLAGAGYARYRYLKSKKGYKGSEIAVNFIPGTSDLIYAIGYHFNLPGKGNKETVPTNTSSSSSSFNTASAMKELKKMESADTKAASKPSASTPSVPHKRPKELSVNHAAAVAAEKAASAPAEPKAAPATPARPATANAAPSPFKPAPAPGTAPKTGSVITGSALGNASAIAARERAEAAKEQLRMRAEARRNIIEEAKKEELKHSAPSSKLEEIKQRPPIKRPASLSVNRAAATAATSSATTANTTTTTTAAGKAPSSKLEEIKQRPPIKRPASLSVNRAAAAAATKDESAVETKAEAPAENSNSPFKPLDRSAERAIYSTPGLRPRKTLEDPHKMSAHATQLGTAVKAQEPKAPYAAGGRTPMWSPSHGKADVNPFKPAGEHAAATSRETAAANTASKHEETQEHTSIADHTTQRSAFFDRAEKARTAPASENKASFVGDLSRPSTKGKAPHAPTVGMNLEGKDSSLLNNGARPTATEPLPGFKPVDWNKE